MLPFKREVLLLLILEQQVNKIEKRTLTSICIQWISSKSPRKPSPVTPSTTINFAAAKRYDSPYLPLVKLHLTCQQTTSETSRRNLHPQPRDNCSSSPIFSFRVTPNPHYAHEAPRSFMVVIVEPCLQSCCLNVGVNRDSVWFLVVLREAADIMIFV